MKRFKSAVTLAEVLVTMGIISIIATFALTIIKPYEKTYKFLYIRIFNQLETSVYNAMLSRSSFPSTSNGFCGMLTEYLNVVQNNCTEVQDLPKYAETFPEDKIKLVLSNGMHLWIGSNGGAPFVKNQTIAGNTYSMKFYMVYVDITGNRPPNRVDWVAGGKMADIVAFAVTESSVVIPLGPPEVDTRYLTARAVYLPFDENCPECNKSAPVTYAEAKSLAWGESMADSEVHSWHFEHGDAISATGPFAVPYPLLPGVKAGEGCTEVNNQVSPCYVKIDNYN